MKINEPGFEIDTNNYPSFRFEELTAEMRFSHLNFDDMDIAWFQENTNTIYICEFKSLTKNIDDIDRGYKRIINALFTKSVPVACMIASIKYKLGILDFKLTCLPKEILQNTDYKIEMYHVIKHPQINDLSAINDALSNRFRPYKMLFQINEFAVISGNQAERKFSGIIKQIEET